MIGIGSLHIQKTKIKIERHTTLCTGPILLLLSFGRTTKTKKKKIFPISPYTTFLHSERTLICHVYTKDYPRPILFSFLAMQPHFRENINMHRSKASKRLHQEPQAPRPATAPRTPSARPAGDPDTASLQTASDSAARGAQTSGRTPTKTSYQRQRAQSRDPPAPKTRTLDFDTIHNLLKMTPKKDDTINFRDPETNFFIVLSFHGAPHNQGHHSDAVYDQSFVAMMSNGEHARFVCKDGSLPNMPTFTTILAFSGDIVKYEKWNPNDADRGHEENLFGYQFVLKNVVCTTGSTLLPSPDLIKLARTGIPQTAFGKIYDGLDADFDKTTGQTVHSCGNTECFLHATKDFTYIGVQGKGSIVVRSSPAINNSIWMHLADYTPTGMNPAPRDNRSITAHVLILNLTAIVTNPTGGVTVCEVGFSLLDSHIVFLSDSKNPRAARETAEWSKRAPRNKPINITCIRDLKDCKNDCVVNFRGVTVTGSTAFKDNKLQLQVQFRDSTTSKVASADVFGTRWSGGDSLQNPETRNSQKFIHDFMLLLVTIKNSAIWARMLAASYHFEYAASLQRRQSSTVSAVAHAPSASTVTPSRRRENEPSANLFKHLGIEAPSAHTPLRQVKKSRGDPTTPPPRFPRFLDDGKDLASIVNGHDYDDPIDAERVESSFLRDPADDSQSDEGYDYFDDEAEEFSGEEEEDSDEEEGSGEDEEEEHDSDDASDAHSGLSDFILNHPGHVQQLRDAKAAAQDQGAVDDDALLLDNAETTELQAEQQ